MERVDQAQTDEHWGYRLKADYPGYMTCMPECGEGWETLIRGFLDVVREHVPNPDHFHLTQLKEKYGEMRIYYHLSSKVSDEVRLAVGKACDATELASETTCEISGRPGIILERSYIWMIRAPDLLEPGDKVDGKSLTAEDIAILRQGETPPLTP